MFQLSLSCQVGRIWNRITRLHLERDWKFLWSIHPTFPYNSTQNYTVLIVQGNLNLKMRVVWLKVTTSAVYRPTRESRELSSKRFNKQTIKYAIYKPLCSHWRPTRCTVRREVSFQQPLRFATTPLNRLLLGPMVSVPGEVAKVKFYCSCISAARVLRETRNEFACPHLNEVGSQKIKATS